MARGTVCILFAGWSARDSREGRGGEGKPAVSHGRDRVESERRHTAPAPRRGQLIHLLTYPLSFTALCSAEVEQQPWATWAVDKGELHHYTGMSVADVERVYEASKEKLLALAAQQHHPNANTPTLTSHNLLAITLHWLRRKPTYHELSHLYPHSGFFWHLIGAEGRRCSRRVHLLPLRPFPCLERPDSCTLPQRQNHRRHHLRSSSKNSFHPRRLP